ncbi:MAG TPA: hypothetical protein VE956_20060 [Nodularia sp. (in: cyanobacteria)]|nr:hypothetical protein [Nodularia sp. (in: cyanobacteria)]
MTRIVQFTSNNWQSFLNYSTTAVILSNQTYIPIEPYTAPTFLNSSIIAVSVETTVPTGRTWVMGGWVEQMFISGLTVGGSIDAGGNSQRMFLDRITVILFPKISANYSLRFHFPKYFKDVRLNCWAYTGIDDTQQDINLAQEFANLNFKIDQL